MKLSRIFHAWGDWESARRFRASVLSTAHRYGISPDSEGVQQLMAQAATFGRMHPITRLRVQKVLEPQQWIGPWLGVPTIKDLLHEIHFLTEVDLLRHHLGKEFHEVNRIVFDSEGTHLFTDETRVACAQGSHAVPEMTSSTEQRRLMMAANLLSQLIGQQVSYKSLVGIRRMSYEKINGNVWVRSTELTE